VAAQLRERVTRSEAPAVGTLGGHRVPRVRGEDDARLERHVVAAYAVRIAAAVDALVVVADHAGLGVHAEASQQALPCGGVVLDQLVFGGGERSRLLQEGGRDGELAHVVHERGAGQHDEAAGGQAQLAPGRHGQNGDAVAVRVSAGVVGGQVGGQHRDQGHWSGAPVAGEEGLERHAPCDPGVCRRLDTPSLLAH
jgi:hypothetical protein